MRRDRLVRWALGPPYVVALLLLAAAPVWADDTPGRAPDYAAAVRAWRTQADAGDRDAQFNLGLAYENGLGVAADAREAAHWYREAAEQEDRQAQAYLAEMYSKGLGIPRDDREALAWYRRAAENGHAAAQYNVGLFYALGRGVEPSPVEAVAWLTVAEENGAPKTELRGQLERNMAAADLDRARRLAADVRRRCHLD